MEAVNSVFFFINILFISYGHLLNMLKDGRCREVVKHSIFMIISFGTYLYVVRQYMLIKKSEDTTGDLFFLLINIFFSIVYFVIIIIGCRK